MILDGLKKHKKQQNQAFHADPKGMRFLAMGSQVFTLTGHLRVTLGADEFYRYT